MELGINSDLESFRSEGRRSQARTGEKTVSPRKRRHTIVGINPSRTSSSRRASYVRGSSNGSDFGDYFSEKQQRAKKYFRGKVKY